ncbi:hypothetical protein [Streptomyces gibsoniae]|uniref:Uncharacterized protein n=1 Tax=Streptomyces gibsoniae TaxID=3075529 RepID=A0ABU2TWX1_9ACTN|nr:hypothetical protein [Streptomyces sp. DSM 41699]MDT0465431.1 hypothetical protein [Streptomyces sp. DSM 41699]
MAAADTLPSDTVFLDAELTPGELAGQVVARVRVDGTSGGGPGHRRFAPPALLPLALPQPAR